jgi:hypothetical protein
MGFHEYEIERNGHKVAEISKRWFRVRDTHGIEVAPGENDGLILAATVCIDEMGARSRSMRTRAIRTCTSSSSPRRREGGSSMRS